MSAPSHAGGRTLRARRGGLTRLRAAGASHRAGMALAEIIIAMALAGGVALALGHIITQLTRNVTSIERRAQHQTETALALLRLRTELRHSMAISALSAHQIGFTHPDLTGDGLPDTVTYTWDGSAGSRLTRELNVAGPETLVENCQDFTLTAMTRLPETYELLCGHVGYGPGVVAATSEFTVSASTRAAEVFSLSGGGGPGFAVYEVRLYVRPLNTSGALLVGLHQTSSGAPGAEIEVISRPLAQLPSAGGWETFHFGGSALNAGSTYAIVVSCSGSGSVAVRYDQITQNVPGTSPDFFRFSTNGGSSWQPTSGLAARDLQYMLYGRWLASGGTPLALSKPYVTGIRISMEAGNEPPLRFESAVWCVNLPEQVQ